MRKNFFTGLALLLPVTLTIFLFLFLLDLFTEPFAGWVHNKIVAYSAAKRLAPWLHYTLAIETVSRLVALALLVVCITAMGALARRWIFRRFWDIIEAILCKIPLIRPLFRTVKEMTSSLFSSTNPFQKTVLVPFLNPDTYAIGFVTGSVPEEIKKQISIPLEHFVFVPNSPHPLSGFLILTKADEVVPVELKGEQALRLLFSAGLVEPSPTPTSPLPQNPVP